jgi:hypothetical protein
MGWHVMKSALYSYVLTNVKHSKKKSRNTVQQAQFLPSNHSVVLPWCTQGLGFVELTVANVNSQGFNVLFSVHHFVRNLLWQKSWGYQETVAFFNLWAFFNALSHIPRLHVELLQSRLKFGCACVQFQYFSFQCLGSSDDLHNLVEINDVPWHFLSSLW